MSVPCFAVVGQPNKGKSSIVATLAEDERVGISPVPGTTRLAERHTFAVGGEPLYTLVDTPGFQRARALLGWLKERSDDASQRRQLVERFVAEHADDERFHDECELLRPILEGAGILYVVDGAKPYGPEYELEMQILQWTGQPRMALINRIGEGDFRAEWRRALDQYFSIVREFDAVGASFDTRLGVLSAFAELNEAWRPQLNRAVQALRGERQRRSRQSARQIAACIAQCLTAVERASVKGPSSREALQATLQNRLLEKLRSEEQRCRRQVQGLYRHERTDVDEGALTLVSMDLFAEEGWELFGLSREKLVVAGALGGAAAGGGIDLLLGGASLLLGTLVGGVLGGVSALLGGREIAKVEVLGEPLGGEVLVVGPVNAANFPWVLLGRALIHHRLVAERNHARREAMSIALGQEAHIMDGVAEAHRKLLAGAFASVRKDGAGSEQVERLTEAIASLMASETEEARDEGSAAHA